METESGCSPRVGAGQMEAVHHLECWQAGEEAIPLTNTGEPSKGIHVVKFSNSYFLGSRP